uniref:Alanyl aminopeptidase, membrane n=1 Tax=Hucho hucho TaxID=62062 RepID=A0A4W5KDY2_9TELE
MCPQWFGNLVTMKWWNDLWLNEGFASYVSYLGANSAEPTWNITDLIVLNEVHGAMSVDALASSHPLSAKEEDIMRPEQISELFDSITYKKGAVVLRMLSEFLTEPVFARGLSVTTHLPMKTSGSDWVLANTKVSGFFRVNYDDSNWERLLTQLSTDHEAIPVINRAQIVDDAFNLASTILALRTTLFLQREREYMPWQTADRNLGYFFLMFDRSDVYGPMQAYLNKQVTPLFNHFKTITADWTKIPEKHTDQYNQVKAISIACSTGVAGCQELTTGWFKDWMNTPENNTQLLNLTLVYLNYCLDPEKIRKQDATFTIVYIAGNVVGQSLAWDFVRSNWDHLFNDYGGGSLSFARLIEGITKRFSSEFELKQLQQFIEENAEQGFGSATLAVDQALERTKANMKWVAENKGDIFTWFTLNSA